ncbi:FKBP-type peptidyl-prolyl cis-trans isomerase [Arcanobacterium canis]
MRLRIERFLIALLIGIGLGALFPWSASSPTKITVTGELGSPVTVISTGNKLKNDFVRTEFAGQGRTITPGTQVLFSATSFDLATGALSAANNSGKLQALSATQENLGDLYQAVIGVKEGSRVLATFTRSVRTEVVVIDILPTIATGEKETATVSLQGFTYGEDSLGRPVVRGKSATGNELDVRILRSGSGIQVRASDQVIGNYRMFDPNGKILDDTWNHNAPVKVTMSQVYPGLHDGLLDQRVGSRVALEIPARLAQGKEAAFVVFDILGVVNA